MSIHIAAKQGEIADKILLPGDPLRAKFIAENFLEDAVCFNEVRNMFGYTGTYKDERVSVMGTGMGMPSISIYARELIVDYGVKKLIRVGTAGSLNKDVHVRELVLAQAAATNSNIIRNDWPQYDFPQIASFNLLDKAYHIAKDLGMTTHVGNVLSSDVFYSNYYEKNIELGKWGVKAVEMEAAALPTVLADVDFAVSNGNYALGAGLTEADGLAFEAADSEAAKTYTNALVVKEGNEDNPAIKKLVEALTSDECRAFLEEKYKGMVIPVF